MAVKFDTTQEARTEDEVAVLVKAVFDAPPTLASQEGNWLEWKTSLDMATPDGRGTVAKAILGFANRAVDEAQLACKGLAYMLVGVAPGVAPGLPAFDFATLGQGMKTYVNGPRWTAQFIDFRGVAVLAIIVEAPKPGHRIYTLQKQYQSGKTTYRAGTVFHRGAAQTEPAGPKEIEMLEERLLQGTRQPDLRLSLTADAQPLVRLYVDEDSIQAWLAAHVQSVRASSGEKPERPKPAAKRPESEGVGIRDFGMTTSAFENLAGIGDMLGRWADPKDREKFEKSVTSYLASCKRGLVDTVIRDIVKSDENKVTLRVHNDTDDSITGVSVRARIPKRGLAVHDSAPPEPRMLPIPKWPNPLDNFRSASGMTGYAAPVGFGSMHSSVDDAGDYFEVRWNIGDVLARDSHELEITIVAGMPAPDVIAIDLEARAKSQRGVATGSAGLQVSSDTPWQLVDWWNPVLAK